MCSGSRLFSAPSTHPYVDPCKSGMLCGAPFPPRPRAIATFLSSADYLPGCQTLLYSVRRHMAPTPDDHYPPEIIVLLSSKVPSAASNIFCDRIIRVEHIPIAKGKNEKNDLNIQAWDENRGWTKLRLFELEGYDTILYIDADCLVLKDVSHLLRIDDPITSSMETEKRVGLLAAAPDMFTPNKFNTGVMLLRPSASVFNEMMCSLGVFPTLKHDSCNPNRELPLSASETRDSTEIYTYYEGRDTGFLNSFYPGWSSDMPSYSRLPFGYNAQRLMNHRNYDSQPKYWDDPIGEITIIHFRSTPKPWENDIDTPICGPNDHALDRKAAYNVQMSNRSMLESMWRAAYERSQQYHKDVVKRRVAHSKQKIQAKPRALPMPSAAPPAKTEPRSVHMLVHKRYNELRRTGMDIKEAMSTARGEYGLDKIDDRDPASAVGQMFGLS
ncbi:hypothetical protein ACHAW5_006890 [Stephanodiscus triporus]|uniref:Hexosyltransferase n=1 Tax=Stephanodiscus triporus TaxID=2934178 RepID=A0ABD3MVD3_9STRA